MPLFKRKPYGLIEPPNDLKSQELVFQVRFTKEIFRDYQEFLKRINLYRQRVWTCKVTGKSNLTYEEALVSERRATEKVQQFPREFMGPVLHVVQFSVLRLEELVNNILKVFREQFMVGEEIVCLQGNVTLPCKVLKVIALEEQGQETGSTQYEIGWLDSEKNIIRTSVESGNRLGRKKLPFSRALLKSFIRESVTNNVARNAPWVVHEKLCRKFKISTEPPEELKKFFVKEEPVIQESNGACKRSPPDDMVLEEAHVYKKRKRKEADASSEGGNKPEDEKVKQEDVVTAPMVKEKPIRYPIEDALVQPSPDDPLFTERPVPSSDFPLSMDCVGPLLMVWNFCTLFGKAIQLSPFSLEEFEKALECSDGDPVVLREANHALLKVVISDPTVHQAFVQKRRQKTKVSIQTWKEDLCDFLELEGLEKLVPHLSPIRKGNYRQLEPSVKLEILCELVNRSLDSTAVRDQLDIYIEEKQAISAQKRREEVEENKKTKEAKEQLRLLQSSDTAHDSTEPNTRVHPEDSDSDEEAEDEEHRTEENFDSNGVIPNGTFENGVVKDDNGPSLPQSRQSKLKLKAALKDAEEKEKEKKKIEEQKKLQEKRRVQNEVVRERKLQEKKMLELQRRHQHLEREIEKRVIRTNPLGRDRDYNRYWFFHREGRVFVENQDSTRWGYYSAKEELDALFGSLNSKGVRERALQRQTEKQCNKISDALQKRSKDVAQRIAMEDASMRRSSRVKCAPRECGIVAYKNKYRN